MSGETGYKPFRMNGNDYYVFYTPFKRALMPGRTTWEQNWSIGIVYPKDDIFGDYNSLLYYVLAISFLGLLLLFLLSRIIMHRQLHSLETLTVSARRIAKGHYDEKIPDSHQEDEIGRLQDNFQQMQQSLATYINELEQLTKTLKERGEGLKVEYDRAQHANRMKTTFLHNMTNQMTGPAEAIERDVAVLMQSSDAISASTSLADDLQHNGKTITELLDNLIHISDKEMRKEGNND
jgi:methyl-accepting chemotaxis protein